MPSDQSSKQEAEPIALEKPVILVVDDSAMMRRAIQRILAEDFQIIEAGDGDEAWETITREHAIEVVFTDLMMPNKNGFQLLRDIRDSMHERINQLPVIILTGHEDDETMKRRAMALGASDFIAKPFDPIQIEARAKSYAKHRDTERKLEQTRQMLASQTTIDSLTGLGNPNYLKQHGPELLAFAARQGVDVSVLRMDIDKFDLLVRKTNRQIGDKVLVSVARTIRSCVRREDIVARVGTAQFAIVMPGSNEDGARRIARRIHEQIGETVYRIGGTRFRMTASGGLLCSAGADDFDALVEKAEALLDNAMESGGASLFVDTIQFERQGQAARSPVDPQLTLDQAAALMRAGQEDKVRAQLGGILQDLVPLLSLANNSLDLGLDNAVDSLVDKLDSGEEPDGD